VVVTDPGSPLDEQATQAGYRVFHADPEVGGRYSALTAFGLVPSGLAGADIGGLLDEAADATATLFADDAANPALRLGAALGVANRSSVDKLVLLDHDAGTAVAWGVGDWIEQLVAESTGKIGHGILPVVVDEHWARVGPLTVAGNTSCLGCHDAARAAADPTWAAVVRQLGRPLVAAPPPSPGPVLLHRLAAAVAEQTAACAGPDRPETVGGVLHLRGRDVVREPVPVHEGCTSLLHRDA
jgi:hypothetical protein